MATKRRLKIAPRKPGAERDAKAAQRFVEAGKTTLPAGPGQRRYGHAGLVRFTAYMTPELKKRLELWCIENDTTGSDVVASLVEKFLDQ